MFYPKSIVSACTTTLCLLLATTAFAEVIPPPVSSFTNAKVRITDDVGSFALNDTDGNPHDDSVSIAPDVAVGFDITPVNPTLPVVDTAGGNLAGLLTKLTNITITATADNVRGSIKIEGDWVFNGYQFSNIPPPTRLILRTALKGTTSYIPDTNRPIEDFQVDFDFEIDFGSITDATRLASKYAPGGPFSTPTNRYFLPVNPDDFPITIPVCVQLHFTLRKAGDSFTLPDSLEISLTVPTPTSAALSLPLLLCGLSRRKRKSH